MLACSRNMKSPDLIIGSRAVKCYKQKRCESMLSIVLFWRHWAVTETAEARWWFWLRNKTGFAGTSTVAVHQLVKSTTVQLFGVSIWFFSVFERNLFFSLRPHLFEHFMWTIPFSRTTHPGHSAVFRRHLKRERFWGGEGLVWVLT